MISARLLLPLLVLTLLLSFIISLSSGSVSVSTTDILQTIFGSPQSSTTNLILELRLPRTLSALLTGALLSVAGSLMQVLVRNPLADPYVLGISGGSAVMALLAMLTGLSGLWITSSAFLGALLAMLLVFGLAHAQGSWNPMRLLLTGVVMASGWGALINFILTVSPEQNLRGMLFWLMGDLSYSDSNIMASIVLVVGMVLCWPLSRDLNVLNRGEQQASVLGVDTHRLQLILFFVASLLTATAVVQAGSIGFIGLVIPHLIRLLGVTDYRYLLPAAALAGGSLLMLADTVARTLLAPQQLPVGIITALLGIPLFLFLLQRGNKTS
jgi:iron complex transport system permease protein